MNKKKRNGFDIFIIGGGINGTSLARDASGRGLRVCLAEMGDLGSATSSASTKLVHGGLRYLEYFNFTLVRESLKERETLLKSMPHICWPMKFIIPYEENIQFQPNTPASKLLFYLMPWKKGKRPSWVIRLGLLFYDFLGKRNILPSSKEINLRNDHRRVPLKEKFVTGFEYWDCWVQDSRFVILNARDAYGLGARIMPYHKVLKVKKTFEGWNVTIKSKKTNQITKIKCKLLINAGGPWVSDIIANTIKSDIPQSTRLVKGSHIVTNKLFDHDSSYFFQGEDGRIIFAIPYEYDYTLIGTTDVLLSNIPKKLKCSSEEKTYLLNFINKYFKKRVKKKDIIWSYAGIRSLYDDGANSETAVSRDYFIKFDQNEMASPAIHIYGGKITTSRKLAEVAIDKVSHIFPHVTEKWTSKSFLPGGNFRTELFNKIEEDILKRHSYLEPELIKRLLRHYGTDVYTMLKNKNKKDDLGVYFGYNLYSFEIDWGIEHEWITCSDDFLWRRTKLGLRLSAKECLSLESYIKKRLQES